MATSNLLPFQKKIINDSVDPASSDLVVLARGLGLRKIICSMLQIYHSKQNLVLLVNARPEEEAGMGEELGIMGVRRPGLRVVGYEMGKRERYVLHFLCSSGYRDPHCLEIRLLSPDDMFM